MYAVRSPWYWPGAAPAPAADVTELTGQVEALVVDGRRLKDAVADVADGAGVGRKALYDAVLASRR